MGTKKSARERQQIDDYKNRFRNDSDAQLRSRIAMGVSIKTASRAINELLKEREKSSIYLCLVKRDDGPELIAANLANQNFHKPWSDNFTDEAGFKAWLEELQSDANASFLVRGGDDDGLVGVFNFSQIVRGVFHSAYLGYYGMEAYCGRGLMTAGLMAALQHAFTQLELHRIEANIRPENTRSVAMVQSVGFRKEGYSPNYLFLDGAWRDHERWAITQEDLSD